MGQRAGSLAGSFSQHGWFRVWHLYTGHAGGVSRLPCPRQMALSDILSQSLSTRVFTSRSCGGLHSPPPDMHTPSGCLVHAPELVWSQDRNVGLKIPEQS